ncbi:MAG: hypothetical protein PHE21_02175 [Candidatus Dojkabacteria bacterium]|nr:hypothetical protein [Candidatus Dojkabacteria bacterium]
MENVDYSIMKTPEGYVCSKCGKSGVKLWREYQTLNPELACAGCAAKSEGKDPSKINSEGMLESDLGLTDQIGWYVPAVPDEEGFGYWGYTSVPQEGVIWWRNLPLEPVF